MIVTPYFMDVDGSIQTLRAGIPGQAGSSIPEKAQRFKILQLEVLRRFPRELSNDRLLLKAVEVLGDTEDAREIDKILFPS